MSSLMDAWLLLQDMEGNGERNRVLYVLKARGMAHSNQIREFLISDHGIDLVDAYIGASGVLTGSARAAQGPSKKPPYWPANRKPPNSSAKWSANARRLNGKSADALRLRNRSRGTAAHCRTGRHANFRAGTERAASGILRQADIKVAAIAQGKPRPGRKN